LSAFTIRSADVIVLTVDAMKITAGKKDIADAIWSGNGRLFSPVNAY
jgi:hypothetical protein